MLGDLTIEFISTAFFFGLIGVAYLMVARRKKRIVLGFSGFMMMVLPYLTRDLALMLTIGAVCAILPFILTWLKMDF